MSIFLQINNRFKSLFMPFSLSKPRAIGVVVISSLIVMTPLVYFTLAENISVGSISNSMLISIVAFCTLAVLSIAGIIFSNLPNYLVFSVIISIYLGVFFLSILVILLNSA